MTRKPSLKRRKLDRAQRVSVNLEDVWTIREEEIYPKLFGQVSRGIFPPTQQPFSRLGEAEVDPRWLFLSSSRLLQSGRHGRVSRPGISW